MTKPSPPFPPEPVKITTLTGFENVQTAILPTSSAKDLPADSIKHNLDKPKYSQL